MVRPPAKSRKRPPGCQCRRHELTSPEPPVYAPSTLGAQVTESGYIAGLGLFGFREIDGRHRGA